MKRIATLLALSLMGCQTQGYQEYALAMSRIAESQASVAREQAQAMILLAKDPQASDTTRTVAIMMLAMGAQNAKSTVQLQPPPNEALQWASVILPSLTNLGLGYFGYRTAVHVSDNQAETTQASYAAFASFKPQPIDFGALTRPNVTNTTTTTTTDVTNQTGLVIVGGGEGSQSPAVIPPVVVVPPVVVGR
jgi:hypothetical protein